MRKEDKKNSDKIKDKINNNNLGVAGIVLGIVSIVNSLFVPIAGIILGIVGLVFCFKQKKVFSNKWSHRGIILNIIGIVLGIIFLIVTAYILANFSDLSQISQLGGY